VPGSFATPLTSAVIAAILGVPEEDTACLQTWAQRSFRTGAGEAVDPEAQAEALQQLLGYLADAAALRRANPSGYDDLLGDLVQAEVDGDRLLEEEVKWLSQGIFVAGYETTANAIGNSMALLAQVPDERRTLRADPGLIADAFEEIVRWDSPAQGFKRTLTRPVGLHGHSLPTGTTILLLPGAANRDERVFDEPDCFRAERRPRHHLAFGQGVHYCLGAPLARLENRIALEIILDWFPDWEIDWATAERSFTGRFMLRGYGRLNALFERR
jgi:cytochrome P450